MRPHTLPALIACLFTLPAHAVTVTGSLSDTEGLMVGDTLTLTLEATFDNEITAGISAWVYFDPYQLEPIGDPYGDEIIALDGFAFDNFDGASLVCISSRCHPFNDIASDLQLHTVTGTFTRYQEFTIASAGEIVLDSGDPTLENWGPLTFTAAPAPTSPEPWEPPPSSGPSAATPEPGGALIFAVGLSVLAARRRLARLG